MPLAVPKDPLRARVNQCSGGLARSRAGKVCLPFWNFINDQTPNPVEAYAKQE